MDIKPVIGAAVAALIGAAIWAGISIVTGYEVGIVAWGLGGLVGFGAAMLGGRGMATGALCAVLTLTSIFAGKMFATDWQIENEVEEFIAETFNPEGYEVAKFEATLFAMLSEDEYPEFMLEFGYTAALDIGEITQEEVDEFGSWAEPAMREFNEEMPSYEEWRDTEVAETRAVVEEDVSITEIVIDDLTVVDFVFAFLGMGTAFTMGSSVRDVREEDEEEIVEDVDA
ncbi:MAG: hypothetical protein IID08_05405 [Candidatus Hydrogenedentes bacterium]|nr:hypothetical protein [Candidatus Hydrogenedentota bacterium]